jgi:ParB family transcriptional regulator, chromosome partitioning protein
MALGWTKKSSSKKSDREERAQQRKHKDKPALEDNKVLKDVPQTLEDVVVKDVQIKGKRRELDPEKVKTLAASIALVGLRNPITVWRIEKERDGAIPTVLVLVAGGYRLEAYKLLGLKRIPAFVIEGDKTAARMLQLIDNLYDTELTALQHAEELTELAEIVQREKGGQAAHPGGKQPHDRGISQAAKVLGFSRREVRRSLEIAGISKEAKAKAKEIGLDKKQSALLKIARETGTEAQLAKIEEIKASRPASVSKASSTGAANKKKTKSAANETTGAGLKAPGPDTGTGEDASGPPLVPEEHFTDLPASDENERLFASLKAAWDEAPRSVRKRFATEVLGVDIEV